MCQTLLSFSMWRPPEFNFTKYTTAAHLKDVLKMSFVLNVIYEPYGRGKPTLINSKTP